MTIVFFFYFTLSFMGPTIHYTISTIFRILSYSLRPKLLESYSILGWPKLLKSFLFLPKNKTSNHTYFILSFTLHSSSLLLYSLFYFIFL